MSDSIQPTDLTVDTHGNIGAVFTGHIVAHGVDLPEAQEKLIGPANFVDWKDAGAVVREEVAGYLTPAGEHVLALRSEPEPGEGQGEVLIYGGKQARVVVGSLGSRRTVLDSLGRSAFLQMAHGFPASAECNFGTFELTYPANSPQSNALGVNHGLGRVPTAVFFGQLGEEGSRLTTLRALERTETTFTAWANATAAFPGAVTFPYCWLAIG